MTIENYNPNWYYHGVLNEEEQKIIRDDFTSYIADESNFVFHPEWDCNVRLSSYSEKPAPWSSFLMATNRCFGEFKEEVGQKKPYTIVNGNLWINRYSTGYNQECHTHCNPEVNLSMVYFYQLDDSDKHSFRFYHPENGQYMMSGLSEFLDLPLYQTFIPEVQEGSLIIFPSFYPHSVSPVKAEGKERITFSGNLLLTQHNWQDRNLFDTNMQRNLQTGPDQHWKVTGDSNSVNTTFGNLPMPGMMGF